MKSALMTWKQILNKNVLAIKRKCFLESKNNQKLYNRLQSPDIVMVIEVHRLEWLGDIVRMDGERTVREPLEGTPGREREKKDLD
jgi:hypothetical protein